MEDDIADILGLEVFEDHNGERHLSAEQVRMIRDIHKETKTALQVVLARLPHAARPGEYVADQYDRNWEPA